MRIKIGNRYVGDGEKPYFIADIAANHDGDIKRAYKLIELAKEAGADCAKFQNFKANRIVSGQGFASMDDQLSHQKSWTKPVFDVYKDASLPNEWSALLKARCDEVDIEYMTSPYDYENVDIADRYVNAYKIGSGDITWTEMLIYIAKKNKPVILATGASSIEDVEQAVGTIARHNKELVLMQCNTNYTASSENYKYINLNVLKTYHEMFPDVILGLSDHTFGYATVLGAVALGARVIEKHFTDDNDREGPDHKFSMTPTSWREMVDETDKLFKALGTGRKKIEENEAETAIVQRRCLYYTANLKSGHIISREDVFPLRPVRDGAFLPYEINSILGKRLTCDVIADNPVMKGEIDA